MPPVSRWQALPKLPGRSFSREKKLQPRLSLLSILLAALHVRSPPPLLPVGHAISLARSFASLPISKAFLEASATLGWIIRCVISSLKYMLSLRYQRVRSRLYLKFKFRIVSAWYIHTLEVNLVDDQKEFYGTSKNIIKNCENDTLN